MGQAAAGLLSRALEVSRTATVQSTNRFMNGLLQLGSWTSLLIATLDADEALQGPQQENEQTSQQWFSKSSGGQELQQGRAWAAGCHWDTVAKPVARSIRARKRSRLIGRRVDVRI
jgi:hypothetical protein